MNPSASAFNSSAVLVSWNPVQTPQGIIIRYVIYKYHPPSNTTAMEATVVPGPQRQGMVEELHPYTEYKFTVRACNSYNCSGHSAAVLARTKPSGVCDPNPTSANVVPRALSCSSIGGRAGKNPGNEVVQVHFNLVYQRS